MNQNLITVLGISFIFIMTTLGAVLVYLTKNNLSEKFNSIFLGFSSGIMIAASIWSLILPAIEQSENMGALKFLPSTIGFILGGLFLAILDKIIINVKGRTENNKLSLSIKKSTKFFIAVTLHNIPEGLAVGFAFGAAAAIGTNAAFIKALGLAIGIGIQNFPEGAAVSLPIKVSTGNKNKSFIFGCLSGAVEPVFAVIGYFLAAFVKILQPWLLSFAAGAMIFVVAEDLIPDAKIESKPNLSAWGVMIGFAVMMILDVALS